MNKTQKRELVKQRRFHHQVCKKTKQLVHIELEPAVIENGYPKPTSSINMDVVHSLTMKELEYIINAKAMKQEGHHEHLLAKLELELTERRLLLAKSSSI